MKQAEGAPRAAGGLVSRDSLSAPRAGRRVARETLEPRAASALRVLPDREARLVRLAAPAGALPAGDADAVAAEMEALLGRRRRHPDRGRRGLARPARSGLRRARAPRRPHGAATARRPTRAACCGSRSCGAGPCSACPPAACSRRPPRSTWCCRASWPAVRRARRESPTLGHGGLLSRDSAYRFPPYRKSAASAASSATDMALYSDVIRERFRRPRFRGAIERPDVAPRGREPALRRPRAHRGPARRRAADRGPVDRRLLRDLRGLRRSAPRGRAGSAGRLRADPDALRACWSGSMPISGRHG